MERERERKGQSNEEGDFPFFFETSPCDITRTHSHCCCLWSRGSQGVLPPHTAVQVDNIFEDLLCTKYVLTQMFTKFIVIIINTLQ